MKHAPSLALFALLGAAAMIACGGDDNGGGSGGGGGGSAAGPSGGSGGDSGSAGTGGTSGGAGSAGTGGTGGTPPLPDPTHFDSAPVTWSTPDGGYEGDFGFLTVSGGDYDPGENYYATMDMTGDGLPDLVLTSDSGKQFGALGSRHWLVHENTGAGFASAPITWATPNGGYEGDFGFLTVAGGDYDPGENYYATMDMTGDGLPDLVLTADSGKQYGALGSRHWLVYENTGSGFASTPVTWATPDGGYEGDFGFLTVSGGDYDPGENYYATMDMMGDGLPDLVLTADSGKQYGALGSRHWLVYENTGSGFAASPITWATPDGGYEGDFGFLVVSGGDYDPGENYYATMDMTGDGLPDLVLTADSGKQFGALGSRHWLVYENTGSGFAASPITWATPDGGYEGDFGLLTVSGGDYDPGENYYATMDMTGDGRPDLVVTSESGKQFGAAGNRHWLVYANTGSGFAGTAATWGTPDGGYEGDFGFLTVSGGDYDPGENYYATMDMTGDGRPDLVVTSESGKQFGPLGSRYWNVYPSVP